MQCDGVYDSVVKQVRGGGGGMYRGGSDEPWLITCCNTNVKVATLLEGLEFKEGVKNWDWCCHNLT